MMVDDMVLSISIFIFILIVWVIYIYLSGKFGKFYERIRVDKIFEKYDSKYISKLEQIIDKVVRVKRHDSKNLYREIIIKYVDGKGMLFWFGEASALNIDRKGWVKVDKFKVNFIEYLYYRLKEIKENTSLIKSIGKEKYDGKVFIKIKYELSEKGKKLEQKMDEL
jgi:hypothetical protein